MPPMFQFDKKAINCHPVNCPNSKGPYEIGVVEIKGHSLINDLLKFQIS